MGNNDIRAIAPDQIVDQLYDIALDPGSLDDFIEAWNAAGFDASEVRQTNERIDEFDQTFRGHLERADKFLERNKSSATSPLTDALAPFNNSAAVVLDHQLNVATGNAGAGTALGLRQGMNVATITLEAGQIELLTSALEANLREASTETRLLKLDAETSEKPVLFHLRRLTETDADGRPLLLLISTQYFWKPELGETLIEVFELTRAELGVVRALVEGRDAKGIAADRGTSEGTVRSQIKSILAKMSARSQSEVIRLVMSLRVVASGTGAQAQQDPSPVNPGGGWLRQEARKPFKSITLPDGRNLDYHDQGPIDGAPILFSHMGYGQVRWTPDMLKLAFKHRVRVIAPVRAGYGQSSKIDKKADILASTRDDTLALLDHLGIERLPYVAQGNDLIFAIDLAAEHPDRISEIVGICARPCIPGDLHYAQMGKWHRFFLSTAKHSPHLSEFTARAAFSLARKIGASAMFQNMNKGSAADHRMTQNRANYEVMEMAATELLLGDKTDAAQAYTMEILASETDWTHRITAAKDTPIWSINGAEDPSVDVSVIAQYREHYPWISFEVVENAGQMLIFQHPDLVVPRLSEAALRAVG